MNDAYMTWNTYAWHDVDFFADAIIVKVAHVVRSRSLSKCSLYHTPAYHLARHAFLLPFLSAHKLLILRFIHNTRFRLSFHLKAWCLPCAPPRARFSEPERRHTSRTLVSFLRVFVIFIYYVFLNIASPPRHILPLRRHRNNARFASISSDVAFQSFSDAFGWRGLVVLMIFGRRSSLH